MIAKLHSSDIDEPDASGMAKPSAAGIDRLNHDRARIDAKKPPKKEIPIRLAFQAHHRARTQALEQRGGFIEQNFGVLYPFESVFLAEDLLGESLVRAANHSLDVLNTDALPAIEAEVIDYVQQRPFCADATDQAQRPAAAGKGPRHADDSVVAYIETHAQALSRPSCRTDFLSERSDTSLPIK